MTEEKYLDHKGVVKKQQIVTIDGPSGVGKSTVSRRVASKLGYTYLDTGAMYRGVAVFFSRLGVDTKEEKVIESRLTEITIELLPATSKEKDIVVLLNGEDVSDAVRTAEISMFASAISALPCVRQYLTHLQRDAGKNGSLVAEGRDMGTVVFPDAANKFYLDASVEERCRRRLRQIQARGGVADEKETLKQIIERDENDRSREHAPLKKADDAVFIDTTALSIDEVCEKIVERSQRENGC